MFKATPIIRARAQSTTAAALAGTMTENQCKCNRWVVSVQSAFESDNFEDMYRKAVQCITPEDFNDITKKQHQ
ncbi:hypothetical protein TELCIR_06563 [Teladorsagia circumcincta]|uniref:Uncharacterized protein n=1 Tax=Teladorsagia circumcincta TaxID=45464 RepID=A0A2G9UMT1_TELCI|nr:hypothetical protein TELCIR_06563 [Teladorsagia circumcincta]